MCLLHDIYITNYILSCLDFKSQAPDPSKHLLGPVYYVHPKIIAHAHGKINEHELANTSYDIKIKIV